LNCTASNCTALNLPRIPRTQWELNAWTQFIFVVIRRNLRGRNVDGFDEQSLLSDRWCHHDRRTSSKPPGEVIGTQFVDTIRGRNVQCPRIRQEAQLLTIGDEFKTTGCGHQAEAGILHPWIHATNSGRRGLSLRSSSLARAVKVEPRVSEAKLRPGPHVELRLPFLRSTHYASKSWLYSRFSGGELLSPRSSAVENRLPPLWC